MYVIAGVSGNTGSVVADTLLSQGKKVRVILRDAKKGEVWKQKGAEVAVAALDDDAALTKAFTGATGAYLLSPPDVRANDFIAERRALVDAIAKAVDAAKVPHVVFLSSIGAQKPSGTGPILTVHYAEERLAKTSAKTTFVRAGSFLENYGAVLGAAKAQGKLPTFLPPDKPISQVATRDIGLVAAKALLEPPAGKSEIIELASGPADLSVRDIAKLVSEILGRPVEVEQGPLEAVVPAFTSFGMSTNIASLYQEMLRGFGDGSIDWQRDGTRFVRGTTDPKAVLAAMLA